MAVCPRCRRADNLALRRTGRVIALGAASLSGVRMKFQGRPEHELSCGCGWSVCGHVEDGHLVETQRPDPRFGDLPVEPR